MSETNPLLNKSSVQGAAKHIEGLLDSKGVISKPQKEEIRNWLSHWYVNWSVPGDHDAINKRKIRIQKNMNRLLEVDSILNPEQRKHAVQEIQIWIDRFQEAIPINRT